MSSDTASAVRSRWIISPLWDTLFFVGTPVLCAACILPLANIWSSVTIWLVVMSFSSFGHHLPGFLRAYGDSELFARYRARFLLAPPLVFGAFLLLALRDLHGAELVLVFWSIWHLMMQHYGFMRIYDAKAGSTGRTAARLDFWLCLSWFAAIALWSPDYRHNVLRGLYNAGIPFLSPGTMNLLYEGATALVIVLTSVYVIHALIALASGRPISVIKLVLHAISMAFLYLIWVTMGDFFLGVAAWEVFHDTQYFALVWVYNRTLVRKGQRVSWLLRFLFRPRFSLVVIYLLLIFGYGGINFATSYVTRETLSAVVVAFLGTSTALHYYYDGFIWKMRQQKTRDALAIDGTEASVGPLEPIGWWRRLAPALDGGRSALHHSLVHAAIFLALIVALGTAETFRSKMGTVEVYESLAALVPDSPKSYTELGMAYRSQNRIEDARKAFEKALELRGDDPEAHNGIGLLYVQRGKSAPKKEAAEHFEKAAEHFNMAIAADPRNRYSYQGLGTLRLNQNRPDEAIDLFQRAIELTPRLRPDRDTASAYEGLALAYRFSNRSEEESKARQEAERIRREFNQSSDEKPGGFVSVYGKR